MQPAQDNVVVFYIKYLIVSGSPRAYARLLATQKEFGHVGVQFPLSIYIIVNSLPATTSRKRLPPVSDHFVNNRFVSQSNTVSKALS